MFWSHDTLKWFVDQENQNEKIQRCLIVFTFGRAQWKEELKNQWKYWCHKMMCIDSLSPYNLRQVTKTTPALDVFTFALSAIELKNNLLTYHQWDEHHYLAVLSLGF